MAPRTATELRGTPCIEEVPEANRQSVFCSRSFGRVVETLAEIGESVTYFADLAATRIRGEGLCTSTVNVILETSRFAEEAQHYAGSLAVPLPQPSNSSAVISQAALALARRAFKPGFFYKKGGVLSVMTLEGFCIQPQSLIVILR